MSIKIMTLVWENFTVGGSEKLAMLAMADWCNDDGGSLYPSISSIAKKINVSESQARRIVHKLIDDGYLAVIGNHAGGDPGQSRQYKMNIKMLYTPIANATPSAGATPSIHAQLPLAPMRETPSTHASLTTNEPLCEPPITLSDKSDGVRLANGKQKYKEDAIQVLEFLNMKTGKHYRPLKANLDLIAARLAEGAQVSDCRGIIVRQARKWMGTDQEMYLRPATLFNATKFAQYSGEISHD